MKIVPLTHPTLNIAGSTAQPLLTGAKNTLQVQKATPSIRNVTFGTMAKTYGLFLGAVCIVGVIAFLLKPKQNPKGQATETPTKPPVNSSVNSSTESSVKSSSTAAKHNALKQEQNNKFYSLRSGIYNLNYNIVSYLMNDQQNPKLTKQYIDELNKQKKSLENFKSFNPSEYSSLNSLIDNNINQLNRSQTSKDKKTSSDHNKTRYDKKSYIDVFQKFYKKYDRETPLDREIKKKESSDPVKLATKLKSEINDLNMLIKALMEIFANAEEIQDKIANDYYQTIGTMIDKRKHYNNAYNWCVEKIYKQKSKNTSHAHTNNSSHNTSSSNSTNATHDTKITIQDKVDSLISGFINEFHPLKDKNININSVILGDGKYNFEDIFYKLKDQKDKTRFFRNLARLIHPDKAASSGLDKDKCTEAFKALNAAHKNAHDG